MFVWATEFALNPSYQYILSNNSYNSPYGSTCLLWGNPKRQTNQGTESRTPSSCSALRKQPFSTKHLGLGFIIQGLGKSQHLVDSMDSMNRGPTCRQQNYYNPYSGHPRRRVILLDNPQILKTYYIRPEA